MNENLKKLSKEAQKRSAEDLKKEFLSKDSSKPPEQKKPPKKYGGGGYGR
jgi:hypothetical protein